MATGDTVSFSWAEVLLVLLTVIAGTGVWQLSVKLASGHMEGAPDDEEPGRATVEAHEEALRRARADVDRLSAAFLQQQIEMNSRESLRASLRARHPSLREPPPSGAAPAPEDVRTAYANAARDIDTAKQMIAYIGARMKSAEGRIVESGKSLSSARTAVAKSGREAKENSSRHQYMWSRSAGLLGVVLLLVVARLLCLSRKGGIANGPRIIGTAALLLSLIIVYDMFGAAGLMVGAIALVALIARAATVKR